MVNAIKQVTFPSVRIAMEGALRTGGVDAAIAQYRRMRARYPSDMFAERTLNSIGYQLLGAKRATDAIAIFKLNAELYPASSNAYDSLGDAYAAANDREDAIDSYRKERSIDPAAMSAIRHARALPAGRHPVHP